MIELREYQTRLVDSVREEIRKGYKKVVMVLPTGGGKSFIAADIAARSVEKGHKVLILAHMRQLVTQMQERLSEYGVQSGLIMAGFEHDLDVPVQIGTIQTYSRRIKLPDERFLIDASVIIVDEAHKSMSPTYQTVLKRYQDKIVIGITATPVLGSGVGMGEYYNSLVDKIPVQELIDQKHLVPVRYFAPSPPDLSRIATRLGDYDKKQLGEKMNQKKLVGDVYMNWAKIAGGLKTMVFAVNVKHSKAIRDDFIKHGVVAEHLDAHHDDEERDSVLKRFISGETQVLCNVGLYCEGSDIPEIECIQLVRPTKSMGLYRQMAGRGLRPAPGKNECVLIDHGGCVHRLGYIEEDIYWSLSGKALCFRKKPRKQKEKPILTCDMCLCAFKGGVCPNCGYQIPDYGKKIAAIEAELVELKKPKQATMDEKRRFWAMLEYYRREKGYQPGWASHKYREKFSVWPKGLDDSVVMPPDNEFMNYMKYLNIKWAKSRKRQEATA